MTDERHERDELAEVVGRRLASWPRKRVTLAELEAVVVAERPELNASVALGTRLAEVVDAVVAAGVVKPSSRRTRFRGVALPVILTRPAAERPRPERPALRHPWRADLAWAGETEGATFEHLRVLDRWLTADPAPAPAPVKERSLEIWGDEKLLDRLRRGPWGQRLPEALALFVVHPPLVIEAISDAAGGLLVENATTWRSLVTAGREHVAAGVPTSIGWIAYGAGNQVAAAVPGLAGHRPDRLWYFGDLDARGLSFAAAAARAAADEAMPPVAPHRGLYKTLLDAGRPQARRKDWAWQPQGLDWLGPDLGPRVVSQLPDTWLAQEWVSLRLLRSDAAWLSP
ncbi:MAG: hypothetical protein ACRD1K_04725 [Acidimicrobiales bacterium]